MNQETDKKIPNTVCPECQCETIRGKCPQCRHLTEEGSQTGESPKLKVILVMIVLASLGVFISIFTKTIKSNFDDKRPAHQVWIEDNSYNAFAACQHFLEKYLKSPATASFSSGRQSNPNFEDKTFTITGDVDSENSFGALVRSNYECTVMERGNKWAPVSLHINDQKLY